MNRMFHALSVRNYRLYASGQVVSTTGMWMGRVTQDWLVYHVLTRDSSLALGIVTALQFTPTLLLSMYGGVLGDRYPKRRVLAITQSAMATTSLCSGLLVVTNLIDVWSMCVIAFLFGIASALDTPVRQAFVVEMVGRDVLQNAVSLNSAMFNLSRMIGPALAGLLIEAFGTAPAFFCNSASYLVVIACLSAMTTKNLHTAAPVARARGQLREGLLYVRRHARLMLPVALTGWVGIFGLNFQITNALMAQGVFHRGAGAYGILSTMQAIGAIAGALLAARQRSAPRVKLLLLAALAFSALETTSAVMPSYLLFMLLLVPTGLAAILVSTSCNTMLQLGAEPHMQGRVVAVYTMVFFGSKPLGSMMVGWIGGAFGPRSSLLFGGVVCGAAAVTCAIFYARSQELALPIAGRLWRPKTEPSGELTDQQLVADTQSQ